MRISEHLVGIAATAKEQQSYNGQDRDHFVSNLYDLAERLRAVAKKLPQKQQAKFQNRAGWAEAYCKTICEDGDVGPMTFWSEMCAIEKLAEDCLAVKKTKQAAAVNKAFASKMKEFYMGLFFSLQKDGLLEKGLEPVNMQGEIGVVAQFYGDQIQGLINELSEDQYPALIALWNQFLKINSKAPMKSGDILNALIALVAAVSDEEAVDEITSEQYASVKMAIQDGDLNKIFEQMLSFSMNTLSIELKVELVKMAIDQPDIYILRCFSECDWFNDMSVEAFKEVAAYALEKKKDEHREIILGSSGYAIEVMFADEAKGT